MGRIHLLGSRFESFILTSTKDSKDSSVFSNGDNYFLSSKIFRVIFDFCLWVSNAYLGSTFQSCVCASTENSKEFVNVKSLDDGVDTCGSAWGNVTDSKFAKL